MNIVINNGVPVPGTVMARVNSYEAMLKKNASSTFSQNVSGAKNSSQRFVNCSAQKNTEGKPDTEFEGDKYALNETLHKVSASRVFFQRTTALNSQGTQYCGIPRQDIASYSGALAKQSTSSMLSLPSHLSKVSTPNVASTGTNGSGNVSVLDVNAKILDQSQFKQQEQSTEPVNETFIMTNHVPVDVPDPRSNIAETNRALRMKFLNGFLTNASEKTLTPSQFPEQQDSAADGAFDNVVKMARSNSMAKSAEYAENISNLYYGRKESNDSGVGSDSQVPASVSDGEQELEWDPSADVKIPVADNDDVTISRELWRDTQKYILQLQEENLLLRNELNLI